MDEPIIKLCDLTKSFYPGVPVFQSINLDIFPGEVFGIIGKSGEGKSTLARCINMLERPSSGEIYFDGNAITTLTYRQLCQTRRRMGMIFQQFNLLQQRTVLENVIFPLEIAGIHKSESVPRALELLELVGLSDKRNSYPSKLSGGQKQRCAIARALAASPKVLLCDEATSALDPETTRGILELLKDLNSRLGLTIVIITHEMSVIETLCSRVAVLSGSSIAEIGTISEVFSNPKTDAAKALLGELDTRRLTNILNERNLSIADAIRIIEKGA